MKRILIVDDDVAVTNYLMVFLVQTGEYEPEVVNDSRLVKELLDKCTFDVVLLDMDMPNVSGMDILKCMRVKGLTTPVVILTGVSDVDLAVKSMKLSAFDYLTKPVDDDDLLEVLNSAIEHSVMNRSIDELPVELTREELTHGDAFANFVAQDKVMIRLFHEVEKIAASDLSIYICGEIGTGKEAVAKAIHHASSRREHPFVAIEADSRLPEQFPGFFFGQARDYSGQLQESPGILEEADKGTIFLDNINALSHPMQVRLKRFIQTGKYYRENSTSIRKANIRIIAASTHDLTSPEYKNQFSRDLLYHLMVNSISTPPLRERTVDIPLLAEKFLKGENAKSSKNVTGFSDEFMDCMMSYNFPGNIQELRSIIAGAFVNEESDVITPDSLPSYIKVAMNMDDAAVHDTFHPRKLDSVILDHVKLTLEHFEDDRGKASEELGISESDLDRLLNQNGPG